MLTCLSTDLDGTLFYGHGAHIFDITERNKKALHYLQQQGKLIALNTGRYQGYGPKLAEYLGLQEVYTSGFGGAVGLKWKEILWSYCLSWQQTEYIIGELRQLHGYENLQIQTMDGFRYLETLDKEPYFSLCEEQKDLNITRVADSTICELLQRQDKEVVKISIMFMNPEVCRSQREVLKKKLGNDYTVVQSSLQDIEILRKEAKKENMLHYLIKAEQLDPTTIAVVGDSENDLDMFLDNVQKYAMANGLDEVKQQADRIVQDVAEIIELQCQIKIEVD